jgi:RES domain-containing protein
VLKGSAQDVAIRRLPSRPLRGTYFRAMPLRFASDLLGKKRPIYAQRFNLANGARMLYLAEDQVTCLHEAHLFGSPLIPVALIPVQFDLHSVIDLRAPAVQKILRTSDAELLFNFRSLSATAGPAPTQVFGERVAASGGIDGLLYASAAHAGHTDLAIIEAALSGLGSSLLVSDPGGGLSERLP